MASSSCPELSVILPSYEEEDNLTWLLPQLQAELNKLGISHETLVIDAEVPRDRTPEVCRKLGVACIARQGGSLYSHALLTGISQSRGRWIMCMDSDGSHPPRFIQELWSARDRADLVIASRYVGGGATQNPAVLIFLSYAVNLTFRLILGFRCRDVSNSFRLYRGDYLRTLELECRNFDILEEILLKMQLRYPDLSIEEIPFTFETRKAGKTKRDLFAFALGYLGTLGRLHRLKKAAMGKHP